MLITFVIPCACYVRLERSGWGTVRLTALVTLVFSFCLLPVAVAMEVV